MQQEFYTVGELAKLTGVSYKTIRYYYEKGLLEPEKISENRYKLYGRKSVEKLQRILMLKYLDFSLDEISKMLKEQDTKEWFTKQQELLQKQKEHLEQVLQAVEEIQKVEKENQWEKLLQIIRMTQQKEEIVKQYRVKDNLQHRINIHAYSTSKTNWYQWVLDGLQLGIGMKVLDIGCGNGMFWICMRDQLPENLNIIMTDSSNEMLKVAKAGLEEYSQLFSEKNITFTYYQIDAEKFEIEEKEFDRVIANHMLYHVSNKSRPELFQKISLLLKDSGMFYASTVGHTHMRELFTLVKEFDSSVSIPNWMSADFELENGGKQLEQIFPIVMVEEQENDLLVPNPQAIYDYVESLPGNAKERLGSKKEEWLTYIKSKVSEKNPYFIHKSTGAFRAFKKK